ncbi:branched-chain amino acid ABC transporter permease [Candidatus Bipolaricaulota bacterium]|nr:branched-chain amino acid ABC transporter permease [Candidatus Bipolaricaulota bacterium]
MSGGSKRYLMKAVASSVAVTSIGVLPLFLGRFQVVLLTEVIIWGVFALSFNLIYGYTGMLSFGQSMFFGAGAYILTYGIIWEFGLPLSLVMVALGGALLGLIVGAVAVRVRGAKFFLVTLVGAILFHLIALDNRWLTGGDDGLLVPLQFRGITENFYLIYGFGLFVGLVTFAIVKSPVGLVFRMIKGDRERAELLGYWTDGYRILSFAIGGAIAALAGGLYGYTTGFVSADFFHWSYSADAVVWTVLGGSGTIAGPFVGAALLTFIREVLSSTWGVVYPVLVGLLLVGLVLGFPDGVVGLLGRISSRYSDKKGADGG